MDYLTEYKGIISSKDLFEKYYLDFYHCTYQAAYQILKDPWIAEDVTAQTFIKLYERFSLYKDIDAMKFRALCCVCAKNEALDYLRHKNISNKVIENYGQIKDTISSFGVPEKEIIAKEELQIVNEAISSLPTSYQKILQLKYSKELSLSEIAKYLNITPKNAEVRLRRARQKLRMILGKGLIVIFTVFLFVHSDTYAQISNFLISQIANKYFLVTEAPLKNNICEDTEPLICNYIPEGYELTQEIQREDVSFLQYTHTRTNRIFFVNRIRAGIDYQLNYNDFNLKMIDYNGDFAIFFEAKSINCSNEFLWYDKENGYVYSITHMADLGEMKRIAAEIH